MNVTLDVFSALIDSRAGASPVFGLIARRAGWRLDGELLYTEWDRANKGMHLQCRDWQPFSVLARRALAEVMAQHELTGDVDAAMAQLWSSIGDWPLWPDSERGLRDLAASHRVGLLSNVDNALLDRTRARRLPLSEDLVITSESVRAYKPRPAIYAAARAIGGANYVHVASSARDVRGALEAGIPVVRLARPGHVVDAAGPQPTVEAADMAELVAHLQDYRGPEPSEEPTSAC